MFIIMTAFLAGAKVLPLIDRETLELQARAEALQPRHQVVQAHRPAPTPQVQRRPAPQPVQTAARAPAKPVVTAPVRQASAQMLRPGPQPVRQQPQLRRASAGNPLDLASITTICRAAGEQDDPRAFIARLSSAYALSADDATSLRSSCAAYLAGRADARRSGAY